MAQFSSIQSLSHIRLFATPWTAAFQASLSITNSRSTPKPVSIESVMPSSHLILCCPLLLLPSIFPSIRVFSNESALRIRWPKCWSFSFNISPSNEHPGLVSFRMDGLVGSPCSPRDSQESSPTPLNTLVYSCLENSMDREAWWATVHGVTKSRTRLSVTNKVKSKTVASEDSLISLSSQFLSSEAIAFWLYHCWLALPVLGLHLNGNTLYIFCCVWVLSLNIISYLRDLHTLLIVMVAVPFFFWVIFHYVNKPQFDYPVFFKWTFKMISNIWLL